MMKDKGERMEEEGLNGLGDLKQSRGGSLGRDNTKDLGKYCYCRHFLKYTYKRSFNGAVL